MENISRPVVIPTDFTVVAQHAIQFAVPFAKMTNASLKLVHIVKSSAEIPEATEKVTAEAQRTSQEHGVQAKGIVLEGSIFSTIGEAVKDLDAGLVVMGTHGIRGMQKLTGSWALKVIVTSKVPVIVVQTLPKKTTIDRIVFPVDFKRENREKLGWAYFVAKLFNAKVHVFRTFPSKDKKLEHGEKTNLVFTEKFLRSKNVPYEITVAQNKGSFAKQTLKYAEDIDADLILITTTKGIGMMDYVFGVYEEEIITNDAHIPIMCVNPRKGIIGGFSATGG